MEAFDRSARADVVRSSFKCTGIWPVSRHAIDPVVFAPGESFSKPVQGEDDRISTTDKEAANEDSSALEEGGPLTGGDKTSTPKNDRHPVLKSLDQLQEIAGPARISLFQTRLEESYDIEDDALYSAWKILKLKSNEIAKEIKEEAIPKSTYDGDLCPIIDKILVYPEITQKGTRAKKKVSLPRHMTSNSALAILELQDKEKRRKELLKEARRVKKEKKGKENTPVLE